MEEDGCKNQRPIYLGDFHLRDHMCVEIAELCRVVHINLQKLSPFAHTELSTFSAIFHAIMLSIPVHLSINKKTSHPGAKIYLFEE